MSFLNKNQLRTSLGLLFRRDTYDPNAVDRAAYNLRLGKDVFRSSSEIPQTLTDKEPYVTIRSGDYVLLTTAEYVTMPLNMLGFITLRYRFKKVGLLNVSGFHVDPGFKGTLVFSVF
jgi:dCTP deaminase